MMGQIIPFILLSISIQTVVLALCVAVWSITVLMGIDNDFGQMWQFGALIGVLLACFCLRHVA